MTVQTEAMAAGQAVSGLRSELGGVMAALLLGVFVVFVAGSRAASSVHEAAHNTRICWPFLPLRLRWRRSARWSLPALIAAAGIAGSLVQAARLWPLIAAAEVIEAAAPVHGHDDGAHAHGWSPEGALRHGLTVLFNVAVGVGFGLVLNALARLASLRGGAAFTARHGVLWGATGFAAFALAPALGLPPELPGMAGGDLLARQLWWVATALCTLGGIGLLALAAGPWRGAGIVLIVLPHLVGAPQADGHGAIPGELGAAFAAASLAASAVFWVVLGTVSGWAQQRLAAR